MAASPDFKAIRKHLDENPRIEQVRLVFFADDDAQVFFRHHVFG